MPRGAVTQLKPPTATVSAVRALRRELAEHAEQDTTEFAAVRSETAVGFEAMGKKLDTLAQNQTLIGDKVNAFDKTTHKPLMAMSQRDLLTKIAIGGGVLLTADKVLFAVGPMTWAFLLAAGRALAGVHN